MRDLRHPNFGITHGGRRIAIDRSEVALPVNQLVAQRELLGHANGRIVHRGITVRVVLTDDVADDAARFALMSWFFEENLSDFSPYASEQTREGFQIIGTSGTITTVAASHLGLKRYDRNKVDGLRMTSDQIDSVIREYLTLGPAGRRNGEPRFYSPGGRFKS